jgi:serine/threonine-protein kinase
MQTGHVVSGRYRLDDLLGEGGIGRVYRAWDAEAGITVALKCLRPEFARDARIRRRFMREARAVARLSHPNIVRLLDYGEDQDGIAFLVMELLDGQPLSEHREQGLHLDALLTIVDQMLAALAYAHARGVVHRDVKPENLLVNFADPRHPSAKLLDFGFARVEDDQDTRLTQIQGDAFGTPLYMAPEQASAKGSVGPATDLYAVGIVLFEFLSGAPPFTGAHGMAVALKHVMEPVPPLVPRVGLSVPLGLDAVVMRCLEKDPVQRPNSAAELRRALSPFRRESAPLDDDAEGGDDAFEATLAAMPVPGHLFGITPFEAAPLSDATILPLQTPGVRPPGLGAQQVAAGGRPGVGQGRDALDAVLAAAPAEAALVGRDDQLLWLWARASEVCADAVTRFAFVHGAPGMGRRRVVQWLRDQLAEGGWMLQISSGTGHDASGAEDLRAVVAALFDGLPNERVQAEARILERLTRFARCASPSPPPDAAQVQTLSTALATWWTGGARDGDEGLRDRADSAYARVLEVMLIAGRDRPMLLAIDSLEQIGPETSGFLSWLARAALRLPVPLLVVAGYDADERGRATRSEVATLVQSLSAVGSPTVDAIGLSPLGPGAVAEIVAPIGRLEASLAEALARRTRGNPFFARELVLYLLQTGELEVAGGEVRVGRTATPAQWPQAIADTLLARTDLTLRALDDPETTARVLEAATLLGESFEYDLLMPFLGRAVGSSPRVERAVEALVQAGIFGESRASDADRLHFVHGILRTALQTRLDARDDWRALHRVAAETLAQHTRSSPGPLAADIAQHYAAGGLPIEAARWYGVAARHLRDRGHAAEACGLLERGDTLLDGQVGHEVELVRAHGWLDLGELELTRAEVARARALATRVYNWAKQGGESALEGRALLLISDLLRRSGQSQDAARGYAQARVAFERAGDAQGYARALLGTAVVERVLGRLDEAFHAFELARAAMEHAGDPLGVARAWRGQGELALRRNDLPTARDRLERARQGYAARGDQPGLVFTQWLLGETHRLLGQFDVAASYFDGSRRLGSSLRDDASVARASLSLARLFRDRGLWPDAEANFDHAAQAFEQAGDHARLAAARAELGLGAAGQRRFDVAERHLTLARQSLTSSGTADSDRLAAILAALAWVAAEQGDEVRCDAELTAAWAIDTQRSVLDPDYARALEGVAEVDTYLGRRTRALLLLERAGAILRALGHAPEADRIERKRALLGTMNPR